VILNDKLLQRLPDAERAKLGKAGLLASECHEIATAKCEAQLQTQIQTMLQRNGIYVVRQRTDKRSTVKVGCPDILFCVGGVAAAWEVKMPGKKPRPEQERALVDMASNGWKTAVVTTYDQALALLAEIRKGRE
jgi:hypothetical protein